MAWTDLKAAVAAVVKTNGTQAITGALLQSTLSSIIDQVGANATFKGVATPTTAPGTPDGPIFYLAVEKGVYSNFGGFVLDGGLAVLSNVTGSWAGTKFLKTEMDAKADHGYGEGETGKTVKDVDDELVQVRSDLSEIEQEQIQGGVYDVSSHNDGAVFKSLSTLLDSANLSTLIPTSVRHGGMSIRFIQGSTPNSDNKYVQWRYMGTAVSGSPNPFLDVANWQGVDDDITAESSNLVKSGSVYREIESVIGTKSEITYTYAATGFYSNKIYTGLRAGETVIINITVNDVRMSNFQIDNVGKYRPTGSVVIASGALTMSRIITYTATVDMDLFMWTQKSNIITDGSLTISVSCQGTLRYINHLLNTRGNLVYTSSLSLSWGDITGSNPQQKSNLTISHGFIINNTRLNSFINSGTNSFENAPYNYGTLYVIFNRNDLTLKELRVGGNAGQNSIATMLSLDTDNEFAYPLVSWINGVIVYDSSSTSKINTLSTNVNTLSTNVNTLSKDMSDLSGVYGNDIVDVPNASEITGNNFVAKIISGAAVGDHYKLVISTKQNNNNISISVLGVSTGYATSGDGRYIFLHNVTSNKVYEVDIQVLVAGDINIWTVKSNIASSGTFEYTVYNYNSKYNLVERVDELEQETGIKETISANIIPPAIYTVCNDITNTDSNRSYALKLQIDHLFRNWTKRYDIHVDGCLNFFPFYSKINNYNSYINSSTANTTNDIDSKTKSIKIVGSLINDLTVPVLHRSTRNKATQDKKVRLLCIGDSVTYGSGASIDLPYSNAPKRYWEWVTALFEMDKIENGNSGYDFITIGNVLNQSINKTSFDINFGNLQKQGVTACACGVGGSRTSDWILPSIQADVTITNPFYDIANGKFSLYYWVNNYRTLVVNQDGSWTRCDSSNKGSLAPIDTTVNNVCEPTHVLIQLGYNQRYSQEGTVRTNYLTQLQTMIDAIHTEYPNVFILLSLPDTPGTYFPELYPDYFGDGDDIYSLDYLRGSAKSAHDQMSLMNTDLISLTDESNNIFYCPTFFATPGCVGSSCRKSNEVGYLSSGDIREKYNVHYGSLPQLHPNNASHANWAYQIYSLIKYTTLL